MKHGVDSELVSKVHEARPNIVDRMINGEVALAINTPFGKSAFVDDTYIRRTALQMNIPCITTLTAATACVEGIRSLKEGVEHVRGAAGTARGDAAAGSVAGGLKRSLATTRHRSFTQIFVFASSVLNGLIARTVY